MRCVIVDDEPEARKLLESYVDRLPGLEHLRSCSDAFQALEVLKEEEVDLLFLDIQMPGLDGMSFLRSLDHPPQVIFTTAYTDYAVEGFELNAVDYLLKPFPFDRFLKAVNKVNDASAGKEKSSHYQFKSEKRIYRVPIERITALESVGDYTHIHLIDKKHLVHGSLQGILSELAGHLLRVHRSHAVNLQHFEYAEGNFLRVGGREVPVGASYREEVRRVLEES